VMSVLSRNMYLEWAVSRIPALAERSQAMTYDCARLALENRRLLGPNVTDSGAEAVGLTRPWREIGSPTNCHSRRSPSDGSSSLTGAIGTAQI